MVEKNSKHQQFSFPMHADPEALPYFEKKLHLGDNKNDSRRNTHQHQQLNFMNTEQINSIKALSKAHEHYLKCANIAQMHLSALFEEMQSFLFAETPNLKKRIVHRQAFKVSGHSSSAISRVALTSEESNEIQTPSTISTAAQVSSLPLHRNKIEILSSGNISSVFGQLFEQQDDYAIQVRLPEPPMLLVDRVTFFDGEQGSMRLGTVWTETDVTADKWYLHHGRVPTGIFIEMGQADLLLISWLGVDFINKGNRAYRLLGCDAIFHGPPPVPGDTLKYEIHVDGHAKTGDVRLFFFHYDCYINGHLRISVRRGQAGFFTKEELANSEGIIWDPSQAPFTKNPRLSKPLVHSKKSSFTEEEMKNFSRGEIVQCLGPEYFMTIPHTRTPHSPSGLLHLIGEVTHLDFTGGPAGRGYLRARSIINPNLWFFQGHFKNDPCMPGTLMVQACGDLISFYLTALGYTLDKDGWVFEAVPNEHYVFRCRGQTIPTSKELIYDVFIDEILYEPYPTIYAHVLGTCDGLKSFLCERLAVRLVPGWPNEPSAAQKTDQKALIRQNIALDRNSLRNVALGKPSNGIGPEMAMFDDRIPAPRLPGPPYLLMSRVTQLNADFQVEKQGANITAELDLKDVKWCFQENGSPTMPYCMLVEAALQPCGWLSTFTWNQKTPVKIHFRNLDGAGTQYREITPDDQCLVTKATLTNVSRFAGNVIVKFHVICTIEEEVVYTLDTAFGFFTPEALAHQVGLPISQEEKVLLQKPSNIAINLADYSPVSTQTSARLPFGKLLMIGMITGYWPNEGKTKCGYLRAEREIRPDDWYFKAHFYQDSVQPGSLGLEAILQLLQFYMLYKRNARYIPDAHFEPIQIGSKMEWHFRGQVIPENSKIIFDLDIIEEGTDDRGDFVIGEARLWVNGLKIYQTTNIGMRLIQRPLPPFIVLKSAPELEKIPRTKSLYIPDDIETLVTEMQERTGFGRTYFYDQTLAMLHQFVRKIELKGNAHLIPWQKEPVIFVANHQTQIESPLCSLVLTVLAQAKMTLEIISRKELLDTCLGVLGILQRTRNDDKGIDGPPVEIRYLDRARPQDFLKLLKDYETRAAKNSRPVSLFVHVEGHRERQAAQKVSKMSSVIIDVALRNHFPIIPIRFTGGLPSANAMDHPLAYPLNYGKQDYIIGQPILPEELENLSFAEKNHYVLDAINALIDEEEQPVPGDVSFKKEIDEMMLKKGISRDSAVFLQCLQKMKYLGNVSQELVTLFQDSDYPKQPESTNPFVNTLYHFIADLKCQIPSA